MRAQRHHLRVEVADGQETPVNKRLFMIPINNPCRHKILLGRRERFLTDNFLRRRQSARAVCHHHRYPVRCVVIYNNRGGGLLL